jgi:hypothetical protein
MRITWLRRLARTGVQVGLFRHDGDGDGLDRGEMSLEWRVTDKKGRCSLVKWKISEGCHGNLKVGACKPKIVNVSRTWPK